MILSASKFAVFNRDGRLEFFFEREVCVYRRGGGVI